MDERPQFDLQKHRAKPYTKKYLVRIVAYIVFLVVLGYVVLDWASKPAKPQQQKKTQSIDSIEQIHGVQIESQSFELSDSI